MAILIDIPLDIEQSLRQSAGGDFDQTTKEALLIEMYRQRRITSAELGRALGLSRFALDGVLKLHGVVDELSFEEVVSESEALHRSRSAHADRR
jgi:hypothetical protein